MSYKNEEDIDGRFISQIVVGEVIFAGAARQDDRDHAAALLDRDGRRGADDRRGAHLVCVWQAAGECGRAGCLCQ